MKKLSKDARTRIDEVIKHLDADEVTLTALYAELKEVVTEFNEFLEAHNERRASLAEIITEQADELSSYMDDRSDRWHEGETAEACRAWHESLTESAEKLLSIDFIEIDEELELNHNEIIEDLQFEVDQ